MIAATGIAAKLAGYADLGLNSFVMGHEIEPGRFDFRGTVLTDGNMLPLYGVIALHCEALSKAPECWEIVHLELDGRPLEPSELDAPTGGAVDAGSLAQGVQSDVPLDAEIGTGAPDPAAPAAPATADDESMQRLAPGADGDDSQFLPEPPGMPSTGTQTASGDGQTLHAVTSDIVNGRAEPGTDSAIVAKLTPGMPLVLLEARGEWGRFRLAGTADGLAAMEAAADGVPPDAEFWIWLPLVAEIEIGGQP